jgi:predicted CoA-binding protein
VVGLSNKSWRPSHRVSRYLLDHGYEVIPVNPELRQVLGRQCYPNLASAPGPVEVVDIFRRAEHIPPIVDEAVQIGAKAVWMQVGLIDEDSAERARCAGLLAVMNRCIMVEHRMHMVGAGPPNESAGAK